MPWTVNDVDKHNKGLSTSQKRKWVAVANNALKSCEAGDVKPEGGGSCDAYAIKAANAAVGKKSSKAADGAALAPRMVAPIRAVEGEDNRYRTYAVVFNDADNRDLYGTWFDGNTDYALEMYPEWPWMYHHGRNTDYGIRKVGIWNDRGIDDVGVFVEGEITAHGAYREAVEQLVAEEVMYTSSQAVHSMVSIDDDGYVERWPICEVSSTVAPGDHRLGHPISPLAERAINVLNDEEATMSLKETLRNLVDVIPDDILTRAENVEAEADADANAGNDVEEDENEELETTVEPEQLDTEELVRAVTDILKLDEFVRAITQLDEHVRAISDRVATLEQLVEGLSQNEVERVKDALDGGEWYNELFVASRDADEVDAEEEDEDVSPEQPLGAQETVFGRITRGPTQ